MKKHFGTFTKSLLLTFIIMLLSFLKVNYTDASGGIYGYNKATYSRGWPVPYVVWTIEREDYTKIASEPLDEYMSEHKNDLSLSPQQSLMGLLVSGLFWFILSSLLVIIITAAKNQEKGEKVK